MKSANLKRLLIAVRQMKSVQRGESAPGRVTVLKSNGRGGHTRHRVDPETWRRRQAVLHVSGVAGVRDRLGLSQQELADLLGISRRTLENWEQGRRQPTGAARILLKVAERHPRAVLEAVA